MKWPSFLICLLIASSLSAEELQPAPTGARFTYHQKSVPDGRGFEIVWLEFLLPSGKAIWVPRYRVPAPLKPVPPGAEFTFRDKTLPTGDGTSIIWQEFRLPDGKLLWIPRYRIGTRKTNVHA